MYVYLKEIVFAYRARQTLLNLFQKSPLNLLWLVCFNLFCTKKSFEILKCYFPNTRHSCVHTIQSALINLSWHLCKQCTFSEALLCHLKLSYERSFVLAWHQIDTRCFQSEIIKSWRFSSILFFIFQTISASLFICLKTCTFFRIAHNLIESIR